MKINLSININQFNKNGNIEIINFLAMNVYYSES